MFLRFSTPLWLNSMLYWVTPPANVFTAIPLFMRYRYFITKYVK